MKQNIRIRNYQRSDRDVCLSLWRELTEWHREIYQDPTIGGDSPEEQSDKHLAKIGPPKIGVPTINSEVAGLTGLDASTLESEIKPLIVIKAHRNRNKTCRKSHS
jgi:hypothetical protein